jgi:hypothetical protein
MNLWPFRRQWTDEEKAEFLLKRRAWPNGQEVTARAINLWFAMLHKKKS